MENGPTMELGNYLESQINEVYGPDYTPTKMIIANVHNLESHKGGQNLPENGFESPLPKAHH
jgi:hypothetical protein